MHHNFFQCNRKSTLRICDLFNFILLLDTFCRLFENLFMSAKSRRQADALQWFCRRIRIRCPPQLYITRSVLSFVLRFTEHYGDDIDLHLRRAMRIIGSTTPNVDPDTNVENTQFLFLTNFVESINHESKNVNNSGRCQQRTRIKIKMANPNEEPNG